ncbi:MAG: hypothetical protein ACI8R4_002837 [Paracoccaceae bacterium]|jgi:hypothetical protein
MLAEFTKFIEKEKAGVKLDAKKIVVFKKPFAIALGEKVNDAGLPQMLGRMDVELELMSRLVKELEDKKALAKLNIAIQK